MTHPHETWQDEPQGKARHARGNRTIVDAFRNEYHAPSKDDDYSTGTPITEADREQLRHLEEQGREELIQQQGIENLCSMN
jgi:hypothetical protein